jgi:hypothetical protein
MAVRRAYGTEGLAWLSDTFLSSFPGPHLEHLRPHLLDLRPRLRLDDLRLRASGQLGLSRVFRDVVPVQLRPGEARHPVRAAAGAGDDVHGDSAAAAAFPQGLRAVPDARVSGRFLGQVDYEIDEWT